MASGESRYSAPASCFRFRRCGKTDRSFRSSSPSHRYGGKAKLSASAAVMRDVTARFEEMKVLLQKISGSNKSGCPLLDEMRPPVGLAETQRLHSARAMNPIEPEAAPITEDTIRTLIDRFYDKVRADPELGPIFARAIPADWEPHLATMRNFWSSVMLTSGRYKGNPVAKHLAVPGIEPQIVRALAGTLRQNMRRRVRRDHRTGLSDESRTYRREPQACVVLSA